MSDSSYPLGPPIRPEPKPVDPDAYIPIPNRPGWAINGKGQMQRTPTLPPVANPWYNLPVIPQGK